MGLERYGRSRSEQQARSERADRNPPAVRGGIRGRDRTGPGSRAPALRAAADRLARSGDCSRWIQWYNESADAAGILHSNAMVTAVRHDRND